MFGITRAYMKFLPSLRVFKEESLQLAHTHTRILRENEGKLRGKRVKFVCVYVVVLAENKRGEWGEGGFDFLKV